MNVDLKNEQPILNKQPNKNKHQAAKRPNTQTVKSQKEEQKNETSVSEIEFCDDIPAVVSVNEAVGIAKKYDGEEAAPFVNGILGKLGNSAGAKK